MSDYVVTTTKQAATDYQKAVETELGLPKPEGRWFGPGAHVEPEKLATEHLADVLESADGKAWAYPKTDAKAALPVGSTVKPVDSTWKPTAKAEPVQTDPKAGEVKVPK